MALSAGGILLGMRLEDAPLVTRSAAVTLLVTALACLRAILA